MDEFSVFPGYFLVSISGYADALTRFTIIDAVSL